jgi:hypothetical protein
MQLKTMLREKEMYQMLNNVNTHVGICANAVEDGGMSYPSTVCLMSKDV